MPAMPPSSSTTPITPTILILLSSVLPSVLILLPTIAPNMLILLSAIARLYGPTTVIVVQVLWSTIPMRIHAQMLLLLTVLLLVS